MKLCSCKDELKVGQVDNWENFWETEEGQNTDFWTEEERKTGTKVKASELKKIRRKEWEEKVGYAEYMEDKEWMSWEVLEEDLQDFEAPQVVIGCDVESLYPSAPGY